MKQLAAFFLIGLLSACNQHTNVPQKTGNPPYKPGLGEIMSGIQMHHAKLWFAGINKNWKLSEYELNEMREMFETAKTIETDRPEVKSIPTIYASLDSVTKAIQQQNIDRFKNQYQSLTNSCNSCHQAVNFEFNVITIPTAPPVTNQDFKPR